MLYILRSQFLTLFRDIKTHSAVFAKKERLVPGRFAWQAGYGVFSYAHSQVHPVIAYIQRQEDHHRVHTFREEYELLLKRFNVEYDPQYVFDWIDDEI